MLERVLDTVRSLTMFGKLDPGVPVLATDDLHQRVQQDAPVLVLFYADWCGYCARYMESFEQEVAEVDVDVVAANISKEVDPRWDTYQVAAVPTLVATRGGKVVARADARPGRGLRPGSLIGLAEQL